MIHSVDVFHCPVSIPKSQYFIVILTITVLELSQYSFLAPPPVPTPITNPCVPSPCGPNSQCRDINGSPSCSCLPNYMGVPPNCRPECVINSECPSNMACIREKCRDPCPGSCGSGATCSVVNHTPICSCPEGFTGDPFSYCNLAPKPSEF